MPQKNESTKLKEVTPVDYHSQATWNPNVPIFLGCKGASPNGVRAKESIRLVLNPPLPN
jgi:hypothetical protein